MGGAIDPSRIRERLLDGVGRLAGSLAISTVVVVAVNLWLAPQGAIARRVGAWISGLMGGLS